MMGLQFLDGDENALNKLFGVIRRIFGNVCVKILEVSSGSI